jgi:hypothetical protein
MQIFFAMVDALSINHLPRQVGACGLNNSRGVGEIEVFDSPEPGFWHAGE